MLTITVNTGDLSDRLDALPSAVKAALYAEAQGISAWLLGIVKAKAAGDVLKVITGRYLESFQSTAKENPKSVSGSVFTKDPSAGILEWGGHEPARTIAPKTAKALYFLASSGEVFAAAVQWPGAQIAPHSVIHSTYLEEKDDVAARLITAGTKAAVAAV
jgi:hypothetical protein